MGQWTRASVFRSAIHRLAIRNVKARSDGLRETWDILFAEPCR
jgi:hypothetical protein